MLRFGAPMKPWMFAFALFACSNETDLGTLPSRIDASPRLVDFGDVPIGAATILSVQVDHLQGAAVAVTDVSVNNVEGEFIAYLGETAFVLDPDASRALEFSYDPLVAGWHRAVVEIVHEAEGLVIPLEIRGHGVALEGTIAPLAIDFGPVAVDTVATRTIAVTNLSTIAWSVDAADLPNPVFTLGSELPIAVAAGATVEVPIQFAPVTDAPEVGSLTLQLGDVALPTVSLRGNDCAGGDSALYDVDRDGFSSCGGDCDDAEVDANPAQTESVDGIDEDCDDRIDDGTSGADDDGDGYCEGPLCTDGTLVGDCNDATIAVNPGVDEILDNGIDDDCDGVVDLGLGDADGDGYAVEGDDCDDTDANRSPANPETPDGVDNDCDVTIDEGTTAYDDDNDGYCELACTDGSIAGDCDDAVAATHPAAGELPDWQDNDCDATVDEGTIRHDDDGDGYTEVGGDCDDADAGTNPALGNC